MLVSILVLCNEKTQKVPVAKIFCRGIPDSEFLTLCDATKIDKNSRGKGPENFQNTRVLASKNDSDNKGCFQLHSQLIDEKSRTFYRMIVGGCIGKFQGGGDGGLSNP
jgi:hypothetical protein